MPHQGKIHPQQPILSENPTAPSADDCGLHLGTTIFGRASKTTSLSRFPPLSNEHPGVDVTGEGAHHIL